MARTNNPNNGHHKRLRISDLFSEGENRTVFGERTALKGHEEHEDVHTPGRGHGDAHTPVFIKVGDACLLA